ncbi:MAG TPA: hypothetical protein VNI20_09665 [Fimbriimonadaceae bacterium]|nr:hypothetical protein [Fimbriimonadaceae bacterium]
MQRHDGLTDAEPVSDEEVRALVERFGERQMGGHGLPTAGGRAVGVSKTVWQG